MRLSCLCKERWGGGGSGLTLAESVAPCRQRSASRDENDSPFLAFLPLPHVHSPRETPTAHRLTAQTQLLSLAGSLGGVGLIAPLGLV